MKESLMIRHEKQQETLKKLGKALNGIAVCGCRRNSENEHISTIELKQYGRCFLNHEQMVFDMSEVVKDLPSKIKSICEKIDKEYEQSMVDKNIESVRSTLAEIGISIKY